MDGTVQVRITIKKYTWHDFVYDVFFVLYATIMISDALCKRYFNLSIPQAYHRIADPVKHAICIVDSFIKKVLLAILVIMIGILALVYSVLVVMVAFDQPPP